MSLAEAQHGLSGWVLFYSKAFTYALSWLFGTSQLLNQCQDCSSSRCLCRCVILASDAKMSYPNVMTTIGIMVVLYTYRREASALLILH